MQCLTLELPKAIKMCHYNTGLDLPPQVQLKFHPTFMRTQLFSASRYDVRFSIKRSTFVFMQNAIARAKLPDVLHPCTLLGKAGELMAPAAADAPPMSPLSFIRVRVIICHIGTPVEHCVVEEFALDFFIAAPI
eukprot:scaffold43199_cov19-Tisochrysis_lutea.AAC.1